MKVWICPMCCATLRKTTDGCKAVCPDCTNTYSLDRLHDQGAITDRKVSADELPFLPRRCPE